MIFGAYGAGKEELPRVLHISIARYNRDLPKTGESLQFLVSIHEDSEKSSSIFIALIVTITNHYQDARKQINARIKRNIEAGII